MSRPNILSPVIVAASQTTIGALFRAGAKVRPNVVALEQNGVQRTYGALLDRVQRLAQGLASLGITRGDRVALLAHNRMEYPEVELAAGMLGAVTACLNWRLVARELQHCINLVEPKLVILEEGLEPSLTGLDLVPHERLRLGPQYEALLARMPAGDVPILAEPEDGLVIVYTSGTTGLPKGAMVSHRAMLTRSLLFASDLGLAPDDAFVAWAPYFHMASTDQGLATLLRGGTVIIIDGYQAGPMIEAAQRHRIGWYVLIPGMIDGFMQAFQAANATPLGIRVCGAMADLVPPQQIAGVSRLLGAPYVNSFGSTETGLPPASRGLLTMGETPKSLSKLQSNFCEVKLVDADDREVETGAPGEVAVRGPTLFLGYWNAAETNAKDFRGGWFHMGDVMRRNADGSLDFVDRAKYMIKTGGENVYPAEIEKVLLGEPRVLDVAVVRARDDRWGEAPVAFVATRDASLTANDLLARCRAELASYKRPREVHFIAFEDFPRSTTGKIQRHELEARLAKARS